MTPAEQVREIMRLRESESTEAMERLQRLRDLQRRIARAHEEAGAEQNREPILLNGRPYDIEALERMEEWFHHHACMTWEGLLEEKGMTPCERLAQYERAEEIGGGVRLITERQMLCGNLVFGLEFGWIALQDGLTRQMLSEKMQKLGDRIWEAVNRDGDGSQ